MLPEMRGNLRHRVIGGRRTGRGDEGAGWRSHWYDRGGWSLHRLGERSRALRCEGGGRGWAGWVAERCLEKAHETQEGGEEEAWGMHDDRLLR